MLEHEFEKQVCRLKDQWPSSYGDQRRLVLWDAFKDVLESDFSDAVTECLGTSRQAPLVVEISESLEKARVRKAQQNRQGGDAVMGYLKDAQKKRRTRNLPITASAWLRVIGKAN